MIVTALRFACFGKLPIHGDFIREVDAAPELRVFDEWQQGGIYRSVTSLGQSWRREFARARPLAFLYRCPQTGGALIGVWVPSADRPGRTYPFVVASRLPEAAPGPWLDTVPLAAGGFLTQARALAESAWRGRDLAEFREDLRRQQWQWDPAASEQALSHRMARTPVHDLFRAAVGGAADVAAMIRLSAELQGVMGGPEPPAPVIRIWFSGEIGDVSCWLRVLRAVAPQLGFPVLVGWTGERRDNSLCLIYGALSSRHFEPLVWSDVDHDGGLDLRGRDDGQNRDAPGFLRAAIEANAMLSELAPATGIRLRS